MLSLYCDGGVIGRNPSEQGGTWAWCQVEDDRRIHSASGIVTPEEVQLPTVTNNVTELIAAVRGLESLPEGWSGTVYTDSLITLYRISRKKPKFNGVPPWLVGRTLAARARAGKFQVVLLGGHPTKAELLAGERRDGFPVSKHNVFCDAQCGIRATQFRNGLMPQMA